MGKKLIITEKPSVAREFARILQVPGRGDGFLENESYVITWCVGHLVEMVYPEEYDIRFKKWKLEDLPFLPKDYKYHVIPAVSGQYDVVHKMLFREDIDTVYWAGDAGKEGQTIEENIRNFGGVREGMEELRVWIDSQTEEEILRGLREAKPMSEYFNLGKSGIMRTIEDYAMGINFSRAMSVKYGRLLNDAAGTKSYTAIAVGRVMTCVLGMAVIREREIRNFTETPFYRIIGTFGEAALDAEWRATEGSIFHESPLLYKENGFRKKEDAEALMTSLAGKEGMVESIEKGSSRKKAPLLFNLAELQAECAKRFKISPDETLAVAQELYEKKLTTYPRTDARYLSMPVAKEIHKNLEKLQNYAPTAAFTKHILEGGLYRNLEKTAYTDDSKVTDHYAIIPTGQVTEQNSLKPLSAKIYDLIVRRFLSIFYPPAEYNTVKLRIKVDTESFYSSAKILKNPGYLEVAGTKKEETEKENKTEETAGDENAEEGVTISENLLSVVETLKKGDPISVQGYSLKEGKTSPPKRYTTGSMVLAMENAGQLIEDEDLRAQIKGSGIGTSATRAEIIKKLIRIGYLNLNKKTQVLTPHALGEMVFETVDMTVPELLNPRMTASWEKGLDGITKGTVDMEEYRTKLEDFIRRETLSMAGEDKRDELLKRISPLTGEEARGIAAKHKIGASCPLCGQEMETTPFGFGCSAYKKDGSGCAFAVGSIAGKKLSEEECVQLLKEGNTDTIRGFKSKAGKKFDACLKLVKNEAGTPKIVFDFENAEPKIMKNAACPLCGSELYVTPFAYRCKTYDNTREDACKFYIGKIAGVRLNEGQVRELLKNGQIGPIDGFIAKTGMKFSASLKLNEEKKVVFDFPDREETTESAVACPSCGKKLRRGKWNLSCDCGVKIRHTVAGLALSDTVMEELLKEGKTKAKVQGFTSKAGKPFDAYLKYTKDETGKENIAFDFEKQDTESKENGNGSIAN